MVVIDAYRGGDDVGYTSNGIIEKEFNLLISQYISNRLNELGISNYLTRDFDKNINITDRSNLIKDAYGNNSNIIAISNRLNYGNENGVEILYSLKNSSSLADKISNGFTERDIYVNKVYQRRDENDTSKDYDELQKNTGNVQTIVISYGYINNQDDINNVLNNYKRYGEAVVKTISNIKGVPYNYTIDNEYIVKKGDSLWSISRLYNITVDELKRYNNLTSNLLNIGQILKIPTNNFNTYVVQKGDSLWSISRKYSTTVDNIKRENNLTSNVLSIGQVLKIPTNNSNTYVVQKGDSLWSISKKFNTTVDNIKKANNLTSNLLNIGQKLIIK